MTDLELLEQAAKPARVKYAPEKSQPHPKSGAWWGLWLVYDDEPSECSRRYWNPLADDGDALRLAVMLGLVVDCSRPSAGEPFKPHSIWLDELSDNGTLTRRAIVRAAAELGKAMAA